MNKSFFKNIINSEVNSNQWRWLDTRYTGWLLAFISFIESVFAPIIIDPFLVAFIVAKREHWIRYVVISIGFSVLGGVAGYLLGALFFDFIGTKIIAVYGLEDAFAQASQKLNANGFVFVLIGALTPIPYKLVAIASGLGQVSFVTFLFASIFGRTIRLVLVGYATYVLGPKALPLVRKHFLKLAYLFAFILIVYLVIKFI